MSRLNSCDPFLKQIISKQKVASVRLALINNLCNGNLIFNTCVNRNNNIDWWNEINSGGEHVCLMTFQFCESFDRAFVINQFVPRSWVTAILSN